MILVLHADGCCTLEEPGDFRHFHCEISSAFDGLASAGAAFARFGELESREIAWVDRPALFALGEQAAGPAWRAAAEAMVEGARRHGWVRAHEPAIKSHIVWCHAHSPRRAD